MQIQVCKTRSRRFYHKKWSVMSSKGYIDDYIGHQEARCFTFAGARRVLEKLCKTLNDYNL